MKKFLAAMLITIIAFLTMPGIALAAYTETRLYNTTYQEDSDNVGYSIAIDGTALVVGARADEYPTLYPGGTNNGAVYLWELSGGTWSNTAIIYDTSGASGDEFGSSVDISGNYIIVGAPGEDTNGSNAGKIYIYDKSGGAGWETTPVLTQLGVEGGDQLGTCVAIDGDKAIAVAPGGGSNPSIDNGRLFFFKETTGTWATDGGADHPGAGGYFTLTNSADISGDYAIIGSPSNSDKAVYVYEYSGGSWNTTPISTLTGGSRFGAGVTIYGDYIWVGEIWYDNPSSPYEQNVGAVHLFVKDGTLWNNTKDLTIPQPELDAYELFGEHMDMDNGIVVFGHHEDDANGNRSGSIYIYEGSGTTWTKTDNLYFSEAAADDYFGYSVGVSGDYIAVGAPFNEETGPPLKQGVGASLVYDDAPAGGGGAVPEFHEYVLMLTVLVAIGLIIWKAPKIQPMRTR